MLRVVQIHNVMLTLAIAIVRKMLKENSVRDVAINSMDIQIAKLVSVMEWEQNLEPLVMKEENVLAKLDTLEISATNAMLNTIKPQKLLHVKNVNANKRVQLIMETVLLELENVLAKVMLKASNVMSVKIPTRDGHHAKKNAIATLRVQKMVLKLVKITDNVNASVMLQV